MKNNYYYRPIEEDNRLAFIIKRQKDENSVVFPWIFFQKVFFNFNSVSQVFINQAICIESKLQNFKLSKSTITFYDDDFFPEGIQLNDYPVNYNEVKNYLKNCGIDISYFINFKGLCWLIKIEGWDKNQLEYSKKIALYFYNFNTNNNNDLIMEIKNDLDIDMVLLLLNSYLGSRRKFSKDLLNTVNFKKLLAYSFYFRALKRNLEYKTLIRFFSNFKKLNANIIKNNEIWDKKIEKMMIHLPRIHCPFPKNYLKIAIRKKFNLNNNTFNRLSINVNNFFKLYFSNFDGFVYIIEVDAYVNNKKVKRYLLGFLDHRPKIVRPIIFPLFNLEILDFIIVFLKTVFFEQKYTIHFDFLQTLDKMVKTGTFRYEKWFPKLQIDRKTAKYVEVKNLNDLILVIESYRIFIC